MPPFAPADNVAPMASGTGPTPAPPATTDPTATPIKMPAPDARIEVKVGMSGSEYANLMEALQQAGLGQIAQLFHQAVNPPAPDENSPANLADEISAMGAARRG